MRYLLIITILVSCCVATSAQVINVSTANQLQAALNNAQPGHIITMADGVYDLNSGVFSPPIGVNGTASQYITLIGSRNAVLTTSDSAHGYGIWLKGNKYWLLKGFTARYCKNGVLIDSSQYITVDSVQTVRIGQSGIDLRRYSSYCTIKNCYVDSCGILDPATGEGVYVGSAYGNWCTNTYCNVDTCNYNQVLYNTFGSHIAAENIDIKEGTTGGVVRGNVLNGAGLMNQNGGDSWIDVKGNYWTIELNTGNNSYLDGFQTHIQQPGWGNYNTFNQNTLHVNASGYGIRITTSNANGTAPNNTVCSNNVVSGATLGLTNIGTKSCSSVVLASKLLYWNVTQKETSLFFNWKISGEIQFIDVEASTDGLHYLSAFIETNPLQVVQRQLNASVTNGSYFRLLMIDKDGSKTYSPVIHLSAKEKDYAIFYQQQQLFINNPQSVADIMLTDLQGKQLLKSVILPGVNRISLPNVQKGIYLLSIIDSKLKKITTRKLII